MSFMMSEEHSVGSMYNTPAAQRKDFAKKSLDWNK